MPVLPRYPIGHPREDLALRALLGQPLILYGHHGDFAEGLDLFAQAAGDINGLGDVRWGPLGAIARGNYAMRQVGEVLHVRMYARRVDVEVPAGVRALRVAAQAPHGGPAWRRVIHAGGGASGTVDMSFEDGLGISESLPVSARGGVELALAPDRPLDPALLATRGVRPWPCLRRALVEGRDRVQPLLRARAAAA